MPKTYGSGLSFRIPFPEGEDNMSRMTNGRAEAHASESGETSGDSGAFCGNEHGSHGSHRRLRAATPSSEPTLLAFADALRDILHDELRPTG
jgi:hypothetical protein